MMSETTRDDRSTKPEQRRILVIGATGYTGQAVVAQLRAEPRTQTWAHIRPDSSSLADWRSRVEAWENVELSTAAWTQETISAEVERIAPTHIFLLLGTTKARGRNGSDSTVADTYEAVDYGLTHLVIEANKAIAKPARVIYLSSIGVKQSTSNPYLKVRARIEAELQRSALSWVSARASFISGPDRQESRPMERISAMTSRPFIALVGAMGAKRFAARFMPRTADELARLLIDAAFDQALQGVVHLDDIARA